MFGVLWCYVQMPKEKRGSNWNGARSYFKRKNPRTLKANVCGTLESYVLRCDDPV